MTVLEQQLKLSERLFVANISNMKGEPSERTIEKIARRSYRQAGVFCTTAFEESRKEKRKIKEEIEGSNVDKEA